MDKKYKTGDGRDVRVLCVDSGIEGLPVVGVIDRSGIASFTKDGKYWSDIGEFHDDLIEVPELQDKQLVWCWDDTYVRELRFYDAKNKCPYRVDGQRDGLLFNNYEPYKGDWPEWAIEAQKTLED